MKTFSPSEAAFEGFRLIGRYPVAIAIWTAVSVVFSLGTLFLAHSMLGPSVLAAMTASQESRTDPTAALAMFAAMGPFILMAMIVGLIIHAVFNAAVFRAELRPQDKGLGYLKLGGDEFRQLGLTIIYALLGFVGWIVAAIAIFVPVAILGAVVKQSGGAGGTLAMVFVMIFGYLALICLAIWVAVRLSLAAPMTFAEKRINLFGSWRVTKGYFWSLFGCYFLTFIFVAIVAIVAGVIGACASVPFGGGIASFKSMVAPDMKTMMAALGPVILVRTVVSALFSGIQRAVLTTPVAAAYKALTVSDAAAIAPDGSVTGAY